MISLIYIFSQFLFKPEHKAVKAAYLLFLSVYLVKDRLSALAEKTYRAFYIVVPAALQDIRPFFFAAAEVGKTFFKLLIFIYRHIVAPFITPIIYPNG